MKIFKRLFLGLTILAILLIGGVFLAVNLIDPNDYKDKIQTLAMEKTGRSLSIDGDIGLSYFPWAGFSLGSISMANPEGFGDSAFVRIDSAQVKVKLLPLLRKSITVDTIELAGLNLDLQRASDGTANWDDLATANDSDTQPDTTTDQNSTKTENGATEKANSLQDLTIGSIIIKDAQINWRDQQNNTDARLTHFNLSSDTIELAKPFSLQTDFTVQSASIGIQAQVEGAGEITADPDNQQYQIKQLKLSTTAIGEAVPIEDFAVDIEGDVVADLLAQTASVTSLILNSTGVVLTGDVQISDLTNNPKINTTLTSNTFSPRKIVQRLNVQLPATRDPEVLKTASVAMSFAGSARSATLNQLSIKLDDTTFSGNAALSDLTRTIPPVSFDLAVDSVDLDRYLPAPNENTNGVAATNTPATDSAVRNEGDTAIILPVDLLRQLDVDGIFKVGNLKASNLTTQNIEIPFSAKTGKISLKDIKASLYEGVLASTVAIDVTSKNPRYQFSTNVNNVQAEPLLQDLVQDTAPLSGEAVISADLSTTGATVNQLIANLNGQYVSDFTDGAINGINIGYQLRRAKSFFSNAAEPAQEPVSKTDFSALHVSARVTNGVIQSDDLDIRAPALRINGAGTIDLAGEFVDYTINPKVVGSVQGQGGKDLDDLKGVAASIPVRGTFEELSQDFTGTIFAAMKEDFSSRAEDAAKALAKKERDKIKAQAKEKADAAKREAKEKLRAEQARAKQRAQEKLTAQKEKAEQAAEEIKDRAKDKLKSLFK